jgi:cell division protein FtsQ
MRDLKTSGKKPTKIRRNKRKRDGNALNWRKFLSRSLTIGVAVTSCVLTIVGLFFLVQMMLSSDLFHVDRVLVKGCHKLEKQQVIALSDIHLGVNTFDLDLELIGQQVEANPWVRNAGVKRIFPSRIEISLNERKPVAIINLGLLYYVDERGDVFKVLDGSDDLNYPIITGFSYAQVEGDDPAFTNELQQVVKLIANLKQRQVMNLQQISEIHRDDSGSLALFTLDNAVKITLGRNDFMKKLNRLEKIYAKLRPQFKVLDYIDLSVDEKVIVRIERPARTVRS